MCPSLPVAARRPSSGRPPGRGWSHRRAVLGVGVATVVAAVATLLVLGAGPGTGPPAGRVVRGTGRSAPAVTHPLEVRTRWDADFDADPTALLVAGPDTFVVTPYSVRALATADGVRRWDVERQDAEPYLAANADTLLVGAVDGFEALDRATGRSRWRSRIEDPFDRARTVGLVATPSGTVAVGTTDRGRVIGLDATTGGLRWSVVVAGTPRGTLATDDVTGAAVLVTERGDATTLVVLDAAAGTVRWSVPLGLGTGSPFVDDTRIVVGTETPTHGVVRAYDLRTGRVRWEHAVSWPFEASEQITRSASELLVLDAGGGVASLDRFTGASRWYQDLGTLVFRGRPVVVHGQVVLFDGFAKLWVLDRGTGAVLRRLVPRGVPVGLGGDRSHLVYAGSQVTWAQVSGLPSQLRRPGGPVDPRRERPARR